MFVGNKKKVMDTLNEKVAIFYMGLPLCIAMLYMLYI